MSPLRGILCGLTAFALAAWAAAGPIPTSTIYTNKQKFRIPFHYDADELSRLGAKEIQLSASRDRGRTWNVVQAVSPNAGKFQFQAPQDGEYWFIVRTLDAQNRLHPDGRVEEPGLQVVVDSLPPKLSLELKQQAPGRVLLTWSASDENLDTTQLRLESLNPGSSQWQPFGVVPKAAGQTEWSVPQGGMVSVRGSISDFARNVATDQKQLRVAASADAVPRANPDWRQPVAGGATPPADHPSLSMQEKFPYTRHEEGAFGPAFTEENPARSQPVDSFVAHRPLADQPRITPGAPQTSAASLARSPEAEDPSPAANARPRVVGSRIFQLGYRLQDVGPSGVSQVELYITEDNGRKWYRYGTDEDCQSPVTVEVPGDGVYGFAIGVKSGTGLGTDPPRDGESPTILVTVDQTPPRIEMLPLEQGRGRNFNKVRIPWRYLEENPAERPITLFYSTTGQAPWLPIAGPLENSGSYVWTIGGQPPPRVYVRIEARDAAGNVQHASTPQPVIIDFSKPTAQIIDVAPDVAPR